MYLETIVKREQIQLIPLMISHLTMFPLVMTAVKKLFMILIIPFIKIKNMFLLEIVAQANQH